MGAATVLRSVAFFAIFLLVKVAIFAVVTSSTEFYHSTDFEVHRHWLALTSSASTFRHQVGITSKQSTQPSCGGKNSVVANVVLKSRFWYPDNSSLWTLDYPPFFGYFEAIMSAAAHDSSPLSPILDEYVFDGAEDRHAALAMRHGEEYASPGTVRFQRLTVLLLSDVPLFLALSLLAAQRPFHKSAGAAALGLALHPALVFIDGMHFQYNGLLFAAFALIIFCSIHHLRFGVAFLYFSLVAAKHLFAYYGLGFAVWGVYVLVKELRKLKVLGTIYFVLQMVAAVALTAALALGPIFVSESLFQLTVDGNTSVAPTAASYNKTVFGTGNAACISDEELWRVMPAVVDNLKRNPAAIVLPQLQAIGTRLFPFGRGLCHAYWAPNAYPVYNVLDRAACAAAPRLIKQLGSSSPIVDVLKQRMPQCGNTSVNSKGIVGLSADDAAVIGSLPTHAILPPITPFVSNVLVLVGAILLGLWAHKSGRRTKQQQGASDAWMETEVLLVGCVVSSAAFFLFSWHVHEKAVITVVVPTMILIWLRASSAGLPDVRETAADAKKNTTDVAVRVAAAYEFSGVASLIVMPLLFTWRENAIKYTWFLCWACFFGPKRGYASALQPMRGLLFFVTILTSVWVDTSAASSFLPLMVHSVICSIAMHRDLLLAIRW